MSPSIRFFVAQGTRLYCTFYRRVLSNESSLQLGEGQIQNLICFYLLKLSLQLMLRKMLKMIVRLMWNLAKQMGNLFKDSSQSPAAIIGNLNLIFSNFSFLYSKSLKNIHWVKLSSLFQPWGLISNFIFMLVLREKENQMMI